MRPVVLLFADEPRAAPLVRSLTPDVGAQQASRLYTVLLRRAVKAADEAGFPVSVWYRPANGRAAVEQVVGEGREMRPQASGTAGSRIAAAASAHSYPAGWIALVRLLEEIDGKLLWAAAEALLDHQVVVGPAQDGGVYLVGGRIAPPAGVTSLSEAGPGALRHLRSALGAAQVVTKELQVHRVIETAGDAKAGGLALGTL